MAAPIAALQASRRQRLQVLRPNLGLQLDRPPLEVDPRALLDCGNVRIHKKRITNQGMGLEKFFVGRLHRGAQLQASVVDGLDGKAAEFAANPESQPTFIYVDDLVDFVQGVSSVRITPDDIWTDPVTYAYSSPPGNLNGLLTFSFKTSTLNITAADLDIEVMDGIGNRSYWHMDNPFPNNNWNDISLNLGTTTRTGGTATPADLTDAAQLKWTFYPSLATVGPIRFDNVRISSLSLPNLYDSCLLIDQFFTREGGQALVLGTRWDLFRWDDINLRLLYLTPTLITGGSPDGGTASITNGDPTISFNTAGIVAAQGMKIGDMIHVAGAGENRVTANWYRVIAVDTALDDVTVERDIEEATSATASYTLRHVFTGDEKDLWSSETFYDGQPHDEDRWYATNGIQMVKWNGNTTTVEAFDPGFVAKSIVAFKNMMIYGNVVVAGESLIDTVINSAIARPEDTSGFEAGQFKAIDGVDSILEMTQLSDTLTLYGDRSITQLMFVGLPLGFVSRTAIPSIGLLGPRMLMDFGDFHEFLSADSGYSFNGVGIEETGPQVFREVLRQIDPNRLALGFAHIDEENGEVMWWIPRTTDESLHAEVEWAGTEVCFSSHYLEEVSENLPLPVTRRVPVNTSTGKKYQPTAGGFFQRSATLRFSDLTGAFSGYSFPWDDRFFEAAFPFTLIGTSEGEVFIVGTRENFEGGGMSSFARLGRLAIGDGDRKAMISRVYPLSEQQPAATYSLGVKVHGALFEDGPSYELSNLGFDLTHAGQRYVTPRVVTRYAEIEVGVNGVDRLWSLSGYGLILSPMGERDV